MPLKLYLSEMERLSNLNLTIVISLAILAFFSFCIFVILIPIALQLSRTLNSAQHLLDTINDDIEPTVKEIKQSVDKVNSVVKRTGTVVKSGFQEAGILAISSAYGVLSAVKDYVSGFKTGKTSYNGKRKDE